VFVNNNTLTEYIDKIFQTGIVCLQTKSSLGALWELSGSSLGALWELSGSSLGALWELSGSSLGALWELVAVAGIACLWTIKIELLYMLANQYKIASK
jgi:hypothetical protein